MTRPTAAFLPLRLASTAPGASAGAWLDWLLRMQRNWTTRRQLAALDAHLLRDIGLTAVEARREADRLPWDPPAR